MRRLRRVTGGFTALFRRHRVEEELDEELRSYLEASAHDRMRAGMSRENAMRAAHVEIGSLEAVKDYTRDVGWEAPLEQFAQDLRIAVRVSVRNPGFTAAAVLTLGLSIGATAAFFSIAYFTLIAPLPFEEPDRLVRVFESHRIPFSPPNRSRVACPFSGWAACLVRDHHRRRWCARADALDVSDAVRSAADGSSYPFWRDHDRACGGSDCLLRPGAKSRGDGSVDYLTRGVRGLLIFRPSSAAS
jgi:hypothetical protein